MSSFVVFGAEHNSLSQLYFTAGSLRCWMDIKYSERYRGKEFPLTDIERLIAEWIPAGAFLFQFFFVFFILPTPVSESCCSWQGTR